MEKINYDEDLLDKLAEEFQTQLLNGIDEKAAFKTKMRYYASAVYFSNTKAPKPNHSKPDRFDLEQQILECWKITNDIPLLESQDANAADMTSLANVYDFKFKQLWQTFEQLVKERKL